MKLTSIDRRAGNLGQSMAGPALIAVCAIMLGRTGAAAEPPRPGGRDGAYEAEFTRQFPLVSGAHHVSDWPLYTALVAGDIVGYAVRIDPALAPRFQQAAGKGYQMQRLTEDINQNQSLRAAFDDQRQRLASMTLYSDGQGTGIEACRQPLVYVDKEFRLVLGQIPRGDQPIAHATVAPKCSQTLETGFQLTAGRSSRFKCWPSDGVTLCGWRLPDMPRDLKEVIESAYPTAIKVRWSWRGLGAVTRVRSVDYNGNRVPRSASVALTVPRELGLEFIDGGGKIRWKADAAGWPASGGPPTAR
jgi:hypothetical protein